MAEPWVLLLFGSGSSGLFFPASDPEPRAGPPSWLSRSPVHVKMGSLREPRKTHLSQCRAPGTP